MSKGGFGKIKFFEDYMCISPFAVAHNSAMLFGDDSPPVHLSSKLAIEIDHGENRDCQGRVVLSTGTMPVRIKLYRFTSIALF
jgi:hypothetical protein